MGREVNFGNKFPVVFALRLKKKKEVLMERKVKSHAEYSKSTIISRI